MSLVGRRICVLVVAVGLVFAATVPAGAVIPPPARLALTFGRPLWWAAEDRGLPLPPGRIVIDWSRDGSA